MTNKLSSTVKRIGLGKVQQYEEKGIPEYWIIDPTGKLVTVLVLKNSSYEKQEFRNEELVSSPAFPNLKLTATQILQAN